MNAFEMMKHIGFGNYTQEVRPVTYDLSEHIESDGGIVFVGDYCYIGDRTRGAVAKYDTDFNYISEFVGIAQTTLEAMTADGIDLHIFMQSNSISEAIDVYSTSGTLISHTLIGLSNAVTYNNGYYYGQPTSPGRIRKYNLSGTYAGQEWDLSNLYSNFYSIHFFDGFYYALFQSSADIIKLNENFEVVGSSPHGLYIAETITSHNGLLYVRGGTLINRGYMIYTYPVF
jgi:hypothetical protein